MLAKHLSDLRARCSWAAPEAGLVVQSVEHELMRVWLPSKLSLQGRKFLQRHERDLQHERRQF